MNLSPACENIDGATSYCYFFGACNVAYSIKDSMVILHTPSGCHRRVLYLWSMNDNSNHNKFLLSTNLIDNDVIFGTEEKLKRLINDTISRYKEKVLFLITSCAPEIIGMDYNLVLRDIENIAGINIIALNGPGFKGDLFTGYMESLYCFIKSLPVKYTERRDNKVNVIGYYFARYEDDERSNIDEIIKLVEKLDLEVNCIFLDGSSYECYTNYSEAKYNIIFQYGSSCEKYLEEKVGQANIICEPPIGMQGTVDFLKILSEKTDRKEQGNKIIQTYLKECIPKIQTTLHVLTGKKVAVIADTQILFGLISFMLELGMEPSIIASYNSYDDFDEKIRQVIQRNSLLEYKPVIIEKCTRIEFKEAIKTMYIDICIGSSIESRDLKDINIPVVEICFPLFEKHYNYKNPIYGFDGLLNINTMIYNSLNPISLRRYGTEKKLESIKNDTYFSCLKGENYDV